MTYTGPYSVTALGALGGDTSLAYDVNRHGHIVGTAAITGNQTQRAFLWQDADHDLVGDDGEMENVGADDGLRSYATAIADSGYIAGVTVYDNCFCGSGGDRREYTTCSTTRISTPLLPIAKRWIPGARPSGT